MKLSMHIGIRRRGLAAVKVFGSFSSQAGKWRAAKKILNIFSCTWSLQKMAKHVSHTIFFPTIDLNYKNILCVVAQNMCETACESSFLCSVSFMYPFLLVNFCTFVSEQYELG